MSIFIYIYICTCIYKYIRFILVNKIQGWLVMEPILEHHFDIFHFVTHLFVFVFLSNVYFVVQYLFYCYFFYFSEISFWFSLLLLSFFFILLRCHFFVSSNCSLNTNYCSLKNLKNKPLNFFSFLLENLHTKKTRVKLFSKIWGYILYVKETHTHFYL